MEMQREVLIRLKRHIIPHKDWRSDRGALIDEELDYTTNSIHKNNEDEDELLDLHHWFNYIVVKVQSLSL